MKRCNKCNTIMADATDNCIFCKQPMKNNYTYICNKCGQVITSNVEKCSRCGATTLFVEEKFFDKHKKFIYCGIALIAIFGMYQLGNINMAKHARKNASITTAETRTQSYNRANTSADMLNETREELKRYGIDEIALATTYQNPHDSFLAIIGNDSNAKVIIVDKKNNRIGSINLNSDLFNIDKYKDAFVVLPISILNDVRDADAIKGTWRGSTHKMVLTVDYKRKSNGILVPGMIKSEFEGLDGSDIYLQEQKNVDIINLFIEKFVSLKQDFQERRNNRIRVWSPYADGDSSMYSDQSNDKDIATIRLLNKYGINDAKIMGTTYGLNKDGVLTIINIRNMVYLVVVDEKNRRAGIIKEFDWAYGFHKRTKDGSFDISIDILNDTKGADQDKGCWKGSTHELPFKAEYKNYGNGKLKPGMIKTKKGAYDFEGVYTEYLQ